MKIAILFEFSGIVRDAFRARGHDAISFDLLDSERPGPHIKGDVRETFIDNFDLAIFHPPCTRLAVSGARWFSLYRDEQEAALDLVKWCFSRKTPKKALENPVSVISSRIRKPDQIIQPWQFGHGETKSTCLWLENLPLLTATNIVDGRNPRVHFESPGPERWKNRSRTYEGVAAAFAEQWGAS